MLLQDKVIIIAGGTGAIGTVTAIKVAQAGAKVIVPIYFLSDHVQRASGNVIEIPHLE